ncbi:MAG: hypothetical protein H7A45_21785 [Verrucomicrobiales bacterium]|nr:hypothetical protein [Verrucomicrobiales bacterium]MCP5519880.1 hypothetical protein [Verrucomicrobiales bacterium]MCP5524907.1 hypothetical protein [Verrucomicrobiales bacterium]
MKTHRRLSHPARRLWLSLSLSSLLAIGGLTLARVRCPAKCGSTVVVLTPDELARARAVLPGI